MTVWNSSYIGSIPFSFSGAMMQLATGVAIPFTIPGTEVDRYIAYFSYTYDAPVWIAINQAAVAPTAATLTPLMNQEFRPDRRFVKGGDVISFISSVGTPQVGVSLLKIPS